MAKEKTPNYSAAQEALIRAKANENGGFIDFAACEALAADPAMNDSDGNARKARSIAAKVTRMADVAYKAKERVTKSGEAIERKDEIVAEIAASVGVATAALESLEKASKPALVALRNAVAA